ncbi:leucine--tRNA ligase [candidate division TA06 bacterium DG_24]|uniref:Leucine--tRNA ligase n=1 Tax=candidate division TA06 bacterium DG_24 TaxID=1703770 RepID=A0A0S7WUR3_UNCT6|nr:MAG: leucine--tRNA ligase [candidate division TA06 bacterium DG_24]
MRETVDQRIYPYEEVERKWREHWERIGLYTTRDDDRPEFYQLVMFAYPSGDVHMGHFRNYVIGDLVARSKMMQGYRVLHPFGWDAFGLPAENAAIERGIHPREWTLGNIETSRQTLRKIAISYDWEREVITCLPDYYRWTQWLFLTLWERDLAYRAEGMVNWCPQCQTVLANEQVSEGRCERCETPVLKRELTQWYFRITAYADRLLEDIDNLDGWPDSIRTMQRNWIGRSEGTGIDFPLESKERKLSVFTTRPDTIYGVTFLTLAPENPLVKELVRGTEREREVTEYVEKAVAKSEIERASIGAKDGVFTGCYALHPFSGERLPLWVADYVLATYGTGIVMGVPAHDQRDFEFARRYGLAIRVVIEPDSRTLRAEEMEEAYVDPGTMRNSDQFNGCPSGEGIEKVTEYAIAKGLGRRRVNYRLRDWLISRQRYWGAPIPMIHCPKCGIVPVPMSELPVELPVENVDFVPKGRSPLADIPSFIEVSCPTCGGPAKRDADTMDTFVCSSWYYLRYLDPKDEAEPFTKEHAAEWLPIDLYIGGAEHATGHLLYFRFIHKVLYDAGLVPTDEPTERLYNHGMVLDAEGYVMSKSRGNVTSPASVMDENGVDSSRLGMLFAAPPDREIEWTGRAVSGAARFLDRLWRLANDHMEQLRQFDPDSLPERIDPTALSGDERDLYRELNVMLKRVSDDVESLDLNTAIAAMMEFLNSLYRFKATSSRIFLLSLRRLVHALAPFAPHIAEELWHRMGNDETVFTSGWISYDEAATEQELITIAVQVNGKVRSRLEVARDAGEEEIRELALADARVKQHTKNKTVRNVVVVPRRLVNIVTS